MSRGFALRMALLATALISSLALGAGQALANHVQCGDTITQDTTLDSDLINCPGDGIIIGADNITLDLNGHVIDGIGGFDGVHPLGVANGNHLDPRGYDRIVIKNGTIQDFVVGVYIGLADANTITGMTFIRSSVFVDGLASDQSEGNIVRRNSFEGGVIDLTNAGATLVDRNEFNAGGGVGLLDSDHIQITRNRFHDAGIGVCCSSHNLIERNVVVCTIEDSGGIGLGDGVRENTISRNSVSGCRVGIGGGDFFDRNVVTRNEAFGNSEDGFAFFSDLGGNVIERNRAWDNGDDGFDIGGSDHYDDRVGDDVARNTAFRNGDFGIEAEPETIDGGGNRAFGNGNPLQCLNIRCR